jgi:hypothetical protein
LISSVGLSNCASGPKVNVCIVDSKNDGYQCVNYKKKEYFLTFPEQLDLVCASPYDTEAFLKACKAGSVLTVTLCSYQIESGQFQCQDPLGKTFLLDVDKADNYLCLSAQHRKRVIERCKG